MIRVLEKGHIKQVWRIPGARRKRRHRQKQKKPEPTYRPNVFCEGNEDVPPPPSKAPFVLRRKDRKDCVTKFTWCLGDESPGGNYLSEMHINFLLMEGWWSCCGKVIVYCGENTKVIWRTKDKSERSDFALQYSPYVAGLHSLVLAHDYCFLAFSEAQWSTQVTALNLNFTA